MESISEAALGPLACHGEGQVPRREDAYVGQHSPSKVRASRHAPASACDPEPVLGSQLLRRSSLINVL